MIKAILNINSINKFNGGLKCLKEIEQVQMEWDQ